MVKTNIYNHYSWSEYAEKEMHWGLEKPLISPCIRAIGYCIKGCLLLIVVNYNNDISLNDNEKDL